MDLQRFTKGVQNSRLYDEGIKSTATATEYADIFSEDIGQLLDLLAPLRTGNRRKPENGCLWQTDDSREARRPSRKLERRYLKTHKDSDRRPYNSVHRASNITSKRVREEFYRAKIEEASGPR